MGSEDDENRYPHDLLVCMNKTQIRIGK